MKIDRLISILIYLLNHKAASAKILSEKFEVSQRTIQRDIDSLNLAGIPIVSIRGVNGGYGISEGYKVERQIASEEDYLHIITALQGLSSGYENKNLTKTLEKLIAVSPTRNGLKQKVYLDFGVLKENDKINHNIELIEAAIETENAVKFEYTDAANVVSNRIVEPLALVYKWYAWYLFGYCTVKKDYRIFKLLRIRNIFTTSKLFIKEHGSIEELLKISQESKDYRRYFDIKLTCKAAIKVAVEEAFPGANINEIDMDDIIINLRVPENERMWFASLMSFGNEITVLEPEELKERLAKKAKEITWLYQ